MKKIIIATIVLFLATVPLLAGRYAGDFMMIGAGVRALGMGGAFAALANDGSAIYWNSAGLAQITSSEVSAMHAFLYNNLASYDHLSYVQPLPNDLSIAVNITRLSVNDIPYFDERHLIGTNVDQRINDSAYHLPGVPDGHFRSTDDLYQIAFAKNIKFGANMGWQFFEVPFEMGLGGNFKFIKRQIKDTLGSGVGLDLGMKVRTDMAVIFDQDELGDLHFGLNFQNVSGTRVTWDTPSSMEDEVLFNTKFGLAAVQPIPKLNSTLTLAYDYDYVYNGTSHYGVDWDYDSKANLRVGYYDTNFSCGASVKLYGVYLDYALINNPIGISNRVGLRISF
ncbi:MAG: UPF0164 family protein [Candidatus Cloacimonetes bacterium]|jgi:hypothetical protein|nr:UPF0164 family protein [Candidatus Cloacimonadota bacterium]MDY0337205.1 UPF0164 family protein [Candidatus Cloacimonadaceae bacterium]MCB5268773.1 UPF0164 family protein [Candidatus Cloacimonadota bacterium]MCK9333883.1 UPF0164 family protein [Candidatus Cloacimonadota bacterium]MDD2543656.1 UPF0164 family protein [Candidatus Cloacimonadota bacterium]